MDFSRSEELLMKHLYNSNKSNLAKIAGTNQDIKFNLELDFNNFLVHVSKKIGKIYNYVVDDDVTEPKVITGKTKDFLFSYTINTNKTSQIDITVLSKYGRVYDASFLKQKFKKTNGYVYFINSEFGYKIGCTYRLEQRVKTFSVKLPFKVDLHSFVECKKYDQVERALHDLLLHRRINGEWFNLTDDDFCEIDRWLNNQNLTRVLP